MNNLSKFVTNNFNASSSEPPKVIEEVQSRLSSGDYDDPRGGISEYELIELIDDVLFDLGLEE